jgi:hypothetical protein
MTMGCILLTRMEEEEGFGAASLAELIRWTEMRKARCRQKRARLETLGSSEWGRAGVTMWKRRVVGHRN